MFTKGACRVPPATPLSLPLSPPSRLWCELLVSCSTNSSLSSMKRIGVFYSYILILPCVLLSFLTLVIFWLPPESSAKMILGECGEGGQTFVDMWGFKLVPPTTLGVLVDTEMGCMNRGWEEAYSVHWARCTCTSRPAKPTL